MGWVEVDGQGRMSGQFAVRAQDVDMGEDELTQNVRYAAEMLQGEDFPEISFTFQDASLNAPVVSGRPSRATLDGAFRLKGVEVRLSTLAEVKATSDSLELRGAFELTGLRERFGIVGPGAEDDPAGNMLRFSFEFVLTPADE
jgi:hypothetical protein